MAAVLVDTNLLVYCYDRREAVKQTRAIEVVAQLGALALGRLSTQCLAEFFHVVTRRRGAILTPEQAEARVTAYMHSWTILDLTPTVVREAMSGVRCHHLNYWDAQIWATARLNQIEAVFSEDFNSGSSLEGVRFVNPFAADFKLKEWV